MSTTVKYLVDGKLSTMWNRIAGSKTTYVALAFVLERGVTVFADGSWQAAETWGQFLPYAFGGVMLILLRSALGKAELAAQAANPEVQNVKAVESTGGGSRGGGLYGMALAGVMLSLFTLTGCGASSALVGADGKPVISGEVCVQTSQGRVCYLPDQPVVVEPRAIVDPQPPPATVRDSRMVRKTLEK